MHLNENVDIKTLYETYRFLYTVDEGTQNGIPTCFYSTQFNFSFIVVNMYVEMLIHMQVRGMHAPEI